MSGRSNKAKALLRWQSVWRLHYEGHSQREIARKLRISLSTVQHYLAKGKPPRSWPEFPYGLQDRSKRPTNRPTIGQPDPGAGPGSGSHSGSPAAANVIPIRRRGA